MNNELFQQAKIAAAGQDFNRAIELYNQCLTDDANPLQSGEQGLVYHQIGNCLTKMQSYYEAIVAYDKAAGDTDYDACGVVNCNMGMAYAALRDWNNAVKHFEIAVSDRNYPTPYKAYMGMGTALLKMDKSAEAGVAFREAALDDANPDPTKALLNLGICFMALGRPADAVTSYESAMQFDMSRDMRNKMNASLGQAYVACGQMQKAVDAFEKAIADKTYFLSASASVDYQRAIGAVSQGTSDLTAILPGHEIDTSGLDVVVTSDSVPFEEAPSYTEANEAISEEYYFADQYADDNDPTSNQERFFTASDEELEEWSKGVVKMERKRKSVGLKVLVVIILLLLALVGAGLFLYTQGFGYPTQESMVEQVFDNPSNSELYAEGVTQEDIASISSLIMPGSKVSIDGVDKSMSSSTAYVTATTPQGGEVQYTVSMVRDMIGWKVSNIDLYFSSQH